MPHRFHTELSLSTRSARNLSGKVVNTPTSTRRAASTSRQTPPTGTPTRRGQPEPWLAAHS